MDAKQEKWQKVPITSIEQIVNSTGRDKEVKVFGKPTSVLLYGELLQGIVSFRLESTLYCKVVSDSFSMWDPGQLATALLEAKEMNQAVTIGGKYDQHSKIFDVKYVRAEAQNLELFP